MNLSPEDVQLFYKLWWSVLAYTNAQVKLTKKIKTASDVRSHNAKEIVKLRDAFYKGTKILDGYLLENPDKLSSEELNLVAAWRFRVVDDFYIFRYLKKYTVFLTAKEPVRLYGVVGLVSPIEEVIPKYALPCLIRTGLLPFRDVIVYDGLFSGYNVTFGSGIRASLTDTYNRVKRRDGIVKSLTDAQGSPLVSTSLDRRRAARKPAQDFAPAVGEIVAQTAKMRGAETEEQNAALSVLRAAATLAQIPLQPSQNNESLLKQIKSVRRALTKLENLIFDEMY
jgi:hypothetical protein